MTEVLTSTPPFSTKQANRMPVQYKSYSDSSMSADAVGQCCSLLMDRFVVVTFDFTKKYFSKYIGTELGAFGYEAFGASGSQAPMDSAVLEESRRSPYIMMPTS